MKKTITITDLTQVRAGDQAYFRNCDFGFTVIDIIEGDAFFTLRVNTPISKDGNWADSALFDHATREVNELEWTKPEDLRLHIYLGSDGKKYLYNPCSEIDTEPWSVENSFAFQSTEKIYRNHMDALPLQELELIHKVSES